LISPFHIWNLYSAIFFWKTLNYGVLVTVVLDMEAFLSTRM